jgi:hypothetical protein
MHDKVHFTFVNSEGNAEKHYVGYDYSKVGSCCGIQVLADIHISRWRQTDDGDEGYFSAMSYRLISKELKLEAFTILRDYINEGGHRRSWTAGVVVLCDYVKMRGNNRAVFLTREFAEWDDWNTDGLAAKNPNSQAHVQLWTKYLTKVKVNPHYQVSEVIDVTNETLADA